MAKKKKPVAAATTASQPASKQAAGVAETAIGRAVWRVGAGKMAGERGGGAGGSEGEGKRLAAESESVGGG